MRRGTLRHGELSRRVERRIAFSEAAVTFSTKPANSRGGRGIDRVFNRAIHHFGNTYGGDE